MTRASFEEHSMKMKPYLILPIFVLAIFASAGQASANFSVYVSINDAYYADLDGDLLADDIKLDLTLEIYNYNFYTSVEVYVGVTLPSGTEYWFVITLDVYKSTTYYGTGLDVNLYDTATESGWYTAHAVGFASGESYSVMESLTFDPPGGYLPGNPSISATTY